MPPKKAAKVKLTKNEQKEREKELDKKLSQEALPKYLTEGLVMLDKDVLCEGVNLYTPDGKIELVKNARVQLLQGRRYGLIGKNGIGKTTLLNQISGYKLENFPQYLRVMHVRQEANIASDMPVLEYVVKSDELKAYLESEETRVLAAIEEGDLEDADGTDLNVKLEKIYERLEDINARTAEGRARQILLGLQFSDAMIAGPTKALSGGWRVRVSLACALFVQPDILLLDEPTNHLDFPAVDWLISYLKVYTKTCIVVSHDRGFLNNVITDVMDMHDQKLDYYRGDYDSYVKTKDENMKLAQRNYDKQEKERVALKQFIEEAKRSKNRQVADMAASRQARLDKMEVLEPPVFEKPWSFTFPDPGSLDHSLVSLIKVNFGWDPTQPEKLLLKNVDGFVDMKSRVGILGANGAGKTTLINLILGKLKPWSGQLKLNEQARTVLFTQHHMDQLDMSLTPLEYVQKLFPLEKEGRIRGFLGHFGFDQNLIAHKIGTLSGGQKSRVAFAILSWNNPHCIIMDEPTNHLDLQTVEALATSLKTFEGGVILISHDIYFLSEVAETFWAVNGAGEVKEFHELDAAKAFSYKPILYKPLDGMQEETKEVKEAFAAKKAAEAALREAEYKKKMAALDSEIANISVESIAQLEEKGEGGGGGGGAGGKGKKAKNKEKEAKAPEPEVKAKPKEPEKDAVEQMLAYHFSASTKKLPKKTVSAAPSRPGMDMAKAGFGALNEFSEEEDLMSEEEVEEKEKKKKKKKDKAEEDGEEGEKEKKKKKKKDKGEDGEEEGEDGEKEKKKKKKKDKGEDEGDEGEGEKEKKKKKKKDKGEDEGDEEDGEKEKKKKKKKDKGEDEGDQGEEKEKKKKKKDKEKEGEEEEGGEKEKKKKKKDKEKEGEEEDGGEKEKKKKKKDKEKEGDEEGEEKEKKKKKKDKEKEDEGEGEDGEKKKKKKKKDKEEGEDEGEGEGEKEKKKKKKDKEKEADAEEDEGAKEKKKKKKEGEDGEVKKEKKEKKPADADDETDAKKDEEEEDGGKKKKKDKKKDKEEDEGAKKKDKKKDKEEDEGAKKKDKKKDKEEEGEKKNKDEDDDGKKKKKNKDKREDEEEETDAVKADKEQKKEKGGGKKKNKKNRDDDDEEEAEGPTAEQQPPEEEDADAIERRERLARLDKKAQSKKERSNANPNASPPATDLATAAATAAEIAAEEVKKEDKGNKKGNKGKKGEEEEGPEVKEDKKGKKGKKGDDEEEEAGGKKDKKKGKKKGGDSEDEEEQGKKGKKKGKKKGGDSDEEEEEEAQKGGKKKKGGKKGAKESEGEDDEEEDNKKGKKKGKKAQQESEGEEDEEEAKGKGGKKKGGKKAKDAEDDGEEEEEAKGKGGKKKGGKKAKGDAEDEDEEEEQPKKGKKKGGKKGKDESDGEEGTEEQKLTGMVKDLSLEDQPKGKKGKGKADEDGEKKPKSKGH